MGYLDSNCKPWSDVTAVDVPNLVIHPEWKASTTASAEVFARGIPSGYLVNQSMAMSE